MGAGLCGGRVLSRWGRGRGWTGPLPSPQWRLPLGLEPQTWGLPDGHGPRGSTGQALWGSWARLSPSRGLPRCPACLRGQHGLGPQQWDRGEGGTVNAGPGPESSGRGSGAPAAELWADLNWDERVSHLVDRPAGGGGLFSWTWCPGDAPGALRSQEALPRSHPGPRAWGRREGRDRRLPCRAREAQGDSSTRLWPRRACACPRGSAPPAPRVPARGRGCAHSPSLPNSSTPRAA